MRFNHPLEPLQDIIRSKSEMRKIVNNTKTLGGRHVIWEFETSLRRERQMDGIAKAKAKAKGGVYRGRRTTISAAEIGKLREAGHGATAIAATLGIGRASVYRLLAVSTENDR